MKTLALLPVALVLPGCVAQLAADIVTAPIKVASKTVDALTTSQSEADEKRGRELRKSEERAEKERRKAEKEARKRAKEMAEDGY